MGNTVRDRPGAADRSGLRVVSPKEIWTDEAGPAPQVVAVGAIVQLFIKQEGVSGFDSVFARVTKADRKKCEAIIVDGPSGTVRQALAFDAGDVFDVL